MPDFFSCLPILMKKESTQARVRRHNCSSGSR